MKVDNMTNSPSLNIACRVPTRAASLIALIWLFAMLSGVVHAQQDTTCG